LNDLVVAFRHASKTIEIVDFGRKIAETRSLIEFPSQIAADDRCWLGIRA
jgi:hypothetical protein